MIASACYHIRESVSRLYEDEEGATMVEYAMMAGLIAAVCAAAVGLVGGKTNALFVKAETQFP